MEEFRICPQCGYARGFHVSFKKNDGKLKVILICPECGSSYDPGLIEDRLTDITIEKGKSY